MSLVKKTKYFALDFNGNVGRIRITLLVPPSSDTTRVSNVAAPIIPTTFAGFSASLVPVSNCNRNTLFEGRTVAASTLPSTMTSKKAEVEKPSRPFNVARTASEGEPTSAVPSEVAALANTKSVLKGTSEITGSKRGYVPATNASAPVG